MKSSTSNCLEKNNKGESIHIISKRRSKLNTGFDLTIKGYELNMKLLMN